MPSTITERLEQGELVLLADKPFTLTPEEQSYLRPDCVDPKVKSVKFSMSRQRMWGTAEADKDSPVLYNMLKRYAAFARELASSLLPEYTALVMGSTSFRPVEAAGRIQSPRKDDRLLHVDAFPSQPMQGKRIFRIFSNVNMSGQPRHWQTGEPFAKVAGRYLPQIRDMLPCEAAVLKTLHITKQKRSAYDHYMLHIHDKMKLDKDYQATAPREDIKIPAGSSWMVFSDQVSHAALSGQHAMEQTFILPVEGMANQAHSPLRVLESMKGQKLL